MSARPSRWKPYWLLVAALTVFAVAPLTYPGFFQAHSGFLPAFNAANPAQAPNWGLTPAQVDPLRGEGQLPYLLVGQIARAASGPHLPYKAVKWGYGLAFLLGALGVFAWTRRWLGERGAVLAATIYTYLPWHLATVYVRGAYAEAWLWAFFPFPLWAVARLAEGRRAALVGLAALAAAAWSQLGLAALFVAVLVGYGAAQVFARRRLALRLGLAGALLILLLWALARAAPAPAVPFADHFLYPYQLVSAAWGFGPSVPGWADGLPFQLGVAALGLGLVALALAAARRIERSLARSLWFWAGTLVVLVALTLPLSAPLWQGTGLAAFLTYPWQILALAGLPLAFLAGAVVRLDERLARLPAWAGLLALVVLASYPYLAPRFTQVDPGTEPVALLRAEDAPAPQILLLDAEIAPPTTLTPTLVLTLTWQAVAPVAEDYTVFVHLLDGTGAKVTQRDTRPCGGACPTDAWQPGEIVVDRYELSLPPDTPLVVSGIESSGGYRLALGLYLLETGERAVVFGRDDRTVYLDVN